MKVPIEVSAHHFHASESDYRTLFGNQDPEPIKNLSQKGQFSTNQTVQATTDSGEIKIRFLGPFRQETQVEISRSDAYILKIDPPLRESVCRNSSLDKINNDNRLCGEGAEITLIGPAGKITKKMAIIAQRHLHINNQKANELGIRNNQMIKIKTNGPRSVVFDNVLARVSSDFDFQVHFDTDEANAAGLGLNDQGELVLEER